jgi:plastocyanin
LRAASDILVLVLAAGEPSKVPFYLAGGVLAGWAVALAAVGLTQPDFPGTQARARMVMGLSALLVLVTVGTAIITSTKHHGEEAQAGERGGHEVAPPTAGTRNQEPGTPASGGAEETVSIAANPEGQLAFEEKTATAKAGTVTIDFDNPSPVAHDVTVAEGERKLGATKIVTEGKAEAQLQLQTGKYVFYCSVANHREQGMEGELAVQ